MNYAIIIGVTFCIVFLKYYIISQLSYSFWQGTFIFYKFYEIIGKLLNCWQLSKCKINMFINV